MRIVCSARYGVISIFVRNRRTATTGPSTAAGGITAWRRDPSGSRASTAGEARSRRSPSGAITRSTAATTASGPEKVTPLRDSDPGSAANLPPGAAAPDPGPVRL